VKYSIFELAERAGVSLRKRPDPKPFDNQFVQDIVSMRKNGLFEAVWIDADNIRVRKPGDEYGSTERLSRLQANALIAEWKLSKVERMPQRKQSLAIVGKVGQK
jgi:hypothetical protein